MFNFQLSDCYVWYINSCAAPIYALSSLNLSVLHPKSCIRATSLFVDRNVIKIWSKQGYFSTTLIRRWPLTAAVWSRARDVVQFCSSNIQFTCHFQSRFSDFFFYKVGQSAFKEKCTVFMTATNLRREEKSQVEKSRLKKKRDAQKRCTPSPMRWLDIHAVVKSWWWFCGPHIQRKGKDSNLLIPSNSEHKTRP